MPPVTVILPTCDRGQLLPRAVASVLAQTEPDFELLIVDNNGLKDPAAIRASGKLLILIQACIHPGESEGKDAGLMLIRDLVIHKKFPGLLDRVSILFIPIFNVDGHERFGPYNRINQNGPGEMGWRVNAGNLNLNRDYLKAVLRSAFTPTSTSASAAG